MPVQQYRLLSCHHKQRAIQNILPARKDKTMKKTCSFLLALCLLLGGVLPVLADAADGLSDPLPAEVQDFISRNYGSYVLEDYIRIAGTPKGTYGFALVAKEGSRRLIGFHLEGGGMTYWLRNDSAAPQGAGKVFFDRNTPQKVVTPGTYYADSLGFTIYRMAPGNVEYLDQGVSYHWEKTGFKLEQYFDRDYYNVMHMHVSDQGIRYQEALNGESTGFVSGEVQRDIRYASFPALPKTVPALREKLSKAPDIPAGELSAQKIKFVGGRKYEVYSAPSASSLRGGSGKAVVSTNDWIQVFGQENGFILIQYDISSTHMRMGYIDAGALPKGASVPSLALTRQPYTLAMNATLTDDPLFSGAALGQLYQGQSVTRLASMGSWAYVETTVNNMTAWGFIPQSALQAPLSLSIAPDGTYRDIRVFPRYQAKAVVSTGAAGQVVGVNVYALLSDAQLSQSPDTLTGYRLYEENRPSHTLTPQPDYQGLKVFSLFTAPASGARVLGLVPIYALSGEKPDESLVIVLK